MQIGLVELACIMPVQSVPPSHEEGLVSFATPAAELYAAFISSWVGKINAAVMLW
jgi:hypothetical protein